MIGEISPRFEGYGFSLTGRSHITAGTPCQDSHLLTHRFGRWQLIAVADGVGSAPCSDQGSASALSALATRCESLLSCDDDAQCLHTLRAGFTCALDSVKQLAQKNSRPLQDYDTTLTACLYDGEALFIGHVGDGGVIGMDESSHYHLLTQVQKGEAWNEVCPLRFGESYWVFEKASVRCVAILLLTDGLLDQAAPSLLYGQSDPLYRGFVSLFLPTDVIAATSADTTVLPEEFEPFGAALGEKLSVLLTQEYYRHLTDDLTAAALWRRDAHPQPSETGYLNEPDWDALRMERYYKLYPHLRREEEYADAAEEPTGAGAAPES